MATSSFFYNGSNAPQDNPNTPVETTGSSDNTVKTSFFYEGISPPSQTSVAALISDLDVKLAAAQQFAEAAALSATQAHAYADNAAASEETIASLLTQANTALSQAQAAQAAASATLIQINAAVTTTNNNVAAAQAAQAAAEAAKVLAETAATNAQTQATNAATSATAAAASATSSASSATNASNSASSIAALIPSQTGNSGKYLKTNGTSTSWATVDAFPSQAGNSGKFLTTNGSGVSWATISVLPATPTVAGTVFAHTDNGTYAPPLTVNYNGHIKPQYPQNSVSWNYGSGGANAVVAAITNGSIQVGQTISISVLQLSTNTIVPIDLGVIISVSGYYDFGYGHNIFGIGVSNPSGWDRNGYYEDVNVGLVVYDIIVGGTVAENVFLGGNAGIGVTSGGENVVVGANAGNTIGSGRNNVVIGNAADVSASSTSNEVTLGNSLHTKTRLFGALALGGSSVGTSGQVLTSQGSGVAPAWTNAGTVYSVNMSVPTGLSVSGGPITSSGTLAVSLASGYSIPTTASQTNWNTAYGWGNHASAGYLTGITSGQVTGALGYTPENSANKNAANGYAGLDGSGLVPSSLLPSYVDDVLEYANLAGFPGTGTTGKIYVALDTNKIYRWSGSTYIEISASPGSTDAVTEGSTNLYFTNARARAAISATGSLSYNSTTGVLSYTQPTNVSTFTNDSGYITSSALSPYLTSATAASTYASLTGSYANPSWITSLAYSKLTGAPTAVSGFTNDAGYATTTYVDTQDALKLNAANPSYTGTLTGGTGVINIGSGQFYKDASGNVGFGTTTMVAKMNVAQSYDSVLIQATNGTVGHRVSYILSGVAYTGTSNAYPLSLMTVGTEAIRIDTSQRVGINKNNPATPLDVNGVITATGGTSTNWNTAYGWGNHASAGYLTSASAVNGANITSGTVTTTQLAASLDLGVLP